MSTSPLDDIRARPVEYDAHGVRYKGWRDACLDSTQEAYPDQPLETPASAPCLYKKVEAKKFGLFQREPVQDVFVG